ncbi:MAG: hypothetical protein L6Q54_00775 [Leptospiraceae bacterium]|nr:hypothetical protein [Leptospiraceae bacterium]MCK6379771.1 hypothetical protein [Leptospiraceae bacterium]
MIRIFSFLICFILLFSSYLYSQEGEDDFLDKVSEEKPKKVTKKENPKNSPQPKRKRKKKKSISKTKNSINKKKIENTLEKSENNSSVSPQKYSEGDWINEELEVKSDRIEGIDRKPENLSTNTEKKSTDFSFNSENKTTISVTEPKPIETKSLLEKFFGSFSDYKKVLIIFGFIIAFIIYRIKVGKSKAGGSSPRGSPRTISNFRKK